MANLRVSLAVSPEPLSLNRLISDSVRNRNRNRKRDAIFHPSKLHVAAHHFLRGYIRLPPGESRSSTFHVDPLV